MSGFDPPADERVREVPGGVTPVGGVTAGATTAGVKPSGRADLALVATDAPCPAAAVTTTNLVRSPTCDRVDTRARGGDVRAVVTVAGNANACLGDDGEVAVDAVSDATASALGCTSEQVLPLATGVIGVPFPTATVVAGIPALVADLDTDGGRRAATAITTTDTVVKEAAVEVVDAAGRCRIGGMAKGAGMIDPAMATLLVVLTTDAPLGRPVLRQLLRASVERSFNRISVDGCGSTNDTVVALATGTAGPPPAPDALQRGLDVVCARLARAVVADGEGTDRVAEVAVGGAASVAQALALARAVADSDLVRAALHGADPNWGRILAAMGASGTAFDPRRVDVRCAGVTVCRFGVAAHFDRGRVAAAMARDEVVIDIDLGLGRAAASVLCADLTPEYVRFNSAYTT